MGNYYSSELKELIEQPLSSITIIDGGTDDPKTVQQWKITNRNYRQKLVDNKDAAQKLIIELLHYQPWANLHS